MKFLHAHSRSTLLGLVSTLLLTASTQFPSEAQPVQPLASPRLFHLKPTTDRLTSGPSWQAGVDIGTVHLLDLLVPGKPVAPDEAIAKFQHTFVLRNDTAADIQVDEVQSDCGCTTWSFDDPVKMKTPFSVAAGAELAVTVSINPQAVEGGAFQHSVTLVMKGQVAPLSQLSIQGYVDNGVAVNNGVQPERTVRIPFSTLGSGTSRHVVLNLDRRLPQYFPADVKLRLVTTNDLLTISPVFPAPMPDSFVRDGVKFDGDVMTFVKGTEILAKDFKFPYELVLAPTAPAGPFNAYLVFASTVPSSVGMLQNVAIPVSGVVHAPDKDTKADLAKKNAKGLEPGTR